MMKLFYLLIFLFSNIALLGQENSDNIIVLKNLKNQYKQGEEICFTIENKGNLKLHIGIIALQQYDSTTNDWNELLSDILISPSLEYEKSVRMDLIIKPHSSQKIRWNPKEYSKNDEQEMMVGDTILKIHLHKFNYKASLGKHRFVINYRTNVDENEFILCDFVIDKK